MQQRHAVDGNGNVQVGRSQVIRDDAEQRGQVVGQVLVVRGEQHIGNLDVRFREQLTVHQLRRYDRSQRNQTGTHQGDASGDVRTLCCSVHGPDLPRVGRLTVKVTYEEA